MFRILYKALGLWLEGLDEHGDCLWNSNKAKAMIWKDSDREKWEDDDDLELIPLAEDEVLARLGAPRLPGFE